MFLGKLLSISAALVVTAGPAAIVAAPAQGQNRPVVVTAPRDDALPTRRVSYADLNLADRSDRTTLNRRVGSAVREVCRESVGLMAPRLVDQRCKSIAYSSARPQVDRAVQRAVELASTGKSSIAAGGISISLSK